MGTYVIGGKSYKVVDHIKQEGILTKKELDTLVAVELIINGNGKITMKEAAENMHIPVTTIAKRIHEWLPKMNFSLYQDLLPILSHTRSYKGPKKEACYRMEGSDQNDKISYKERLDEVKKCHL